MYLWRNMGSSFSQKASDASIFESREVAESMLFHISFGEKDSRYYIKPLSEIRGRLAGEKFNF